MFKKQSFQLSPEDQSLIRCAMLLDVAQCKAFLKQYPGTVPFEEKLENLERVLNLLYKTQDVTVDSLVETDPAVDSIFTY